MTSLLVLGGSGFVGHAVVAEGVKRGLAVTTFNRGRSGEQPPAGVRVIHGDRLDPDSLAPLTAQSWDVVIDTWSGAPVAVREAAGRLRGRAGQYVYVSSGSVYPPPLEVGLDELTPTVEGSPDDIDDADYARAKRGGELAAVAAFGERALLARCGLILGPREDVGRLPWWLARMARGGEVLAPGPPERPLQFIDARDLARFLIDAAQAGLGGPFNLVSRRGHATMGKLLGACRAVTASARDGDAQFCWTAPEVIAECGIEAWTELPVWLPLGTEYEGLHGMDVERAHEAGLQCRSLEETVADTWAWMTGLGGAQPVRAGRPSPGLSPERERAALAAAMRSSG
ncbi:MAG TPA: NAD-dependent epimerase/dehydratase family protein [Solirubrobacteraceae bacterium]|nr:NAD-dependent epimerase/dehydratase family protein [Solirubrobacteraceae bacterium]